MSEEAIKDEIVEEVVEEVVEEPEYSDTELKAIEMGWNPEGVEGKESISAEEFVARKPFFDEIRGLKKALKNRDKDIENLKKGFESMNEKAVEKAIKQLKREKLEALENGEHERVIEIDDEIAEATAAKTANSTQTNQAFEDFVEDNPWYGSNDKLSFYADGIGNRLVQKGYDPNTPEFFAEVTKRVKEEYKEDFAPKARQRRSPVEGSTRATTQSKSKYSRNDLPEEHRKIMDSMVRQGIVSADEYLKDYFE